MAKLEEGAQAPSFTLPDQDGNPVTLSGFLVGLLLSFFSTTRSPLSALAGAVLGAGGLFLVAFLYERIAGHEGMGLGDVKMLGMIGANQQVIEMLDAIEAEGGDVQRARLGHAGELGASGRAGFPASVISALTCPCPGVSISSARAETVSTSRSARPACATCSSCAAVTPLTPIAPMGAPPAMIVTPPTA